MCAHDPVPAWLALGERATEQRRWRVRGFQAPAPGGTRCEVRFAGTVEAETASGLSNRYAVHRYIPLIERDRHGDVVQGTELGTMTHHSTVASEQ